MKTVRNIIGFCSRIFCPVEFEILVCEMKSISKEKTDFLGIGIGFGRKTGGSASSSASTHSLFASLSVMTEPTSSLRKLNAKLTVSNYRTEKKESSIVVCFENVKDLLDQQ